MLQSRMYECNFTNQIGSTHQNKINYQTPNPLTKNQTSNTKGQHEDRKKYMKENRHIMIPRNDEAKNSLKQLKTVNHKSISSL